MSQRFRQDRRTWEYEFEDKGARHRGSGYATKRQARDAESDHRNRVRAASIAANRPGLTITLKDYVELWMSDHVKVNCRPRTARAYRQALDLHILPRLGGRGLAQLTRAELRSCFAELAASGLARNTIKNCLIPLRACLTHAVEDGLLEQNPATGLGRRTRAQTEREAKRVDSYSREELAAILGGVMPQDDRVFFRLLAQSGLRLSEALGLQLGDLGGDHLWVRRSVQWQDAEWREYAPKSGEARRVDIPITLEVALRQVQAGHGGRFIFGGATPWRPERIRKAWYSAVERSKTRRLRLHDLRHTYAAMLLTAGAPVAYVKEQLGHSSIQVTVDTYGHLIPGSNRKWVDNTFREEP